MKRTIQLAVACMAVMLTVGQVHAVPILTFFIDGDTFGQSFSITNSSDGGESIIGFHLDLTPVSPGVHFDTAGTGTPVPFTPVNGPAVGLTSPATVADATKILDLVFTAGEFLPGESFLWNIDIDEDPSPNASTITGDEVIGASVYADFSDGQRLTGFLQAVSGNADASIFTATGLVIIPPDNNEVPEPTSLAIFGIGALCMGAGAARRKRKEKLAAA